MGHRRKHKAVEKMVTESLTLKRQRQLCIDQRERDHMGDAGVGSLKPRAKRG
jgi:hypothetical protein